MGLRRLAYVCRRQLVRRLSVNIRSTLLTPQRLPFQSQTTANYIVSLLYVHEYDFPGGLGVTNIKFRVLVWGISEGLLVLIVALNYLPQKTYSWVFKGSTVLMGVDFCSSFLPSFPCPTPTADLPHIYPILPPVINLIWMPIAASRTYGFRSASEALLTQNNGTGMPSGWNWLLVMIYATGNLIGWDAAGHIAEETIDASRVAARGIFWSALSSGSCAFAACILFLFVTPSVCVVPCPYTRPFLISH